MSDQGWIGVDLDGTLAFHTSENWDYPHIGPPILPMVNRVKGWLKDGKDVRIVTARVSADEAFGGKESADGNREHIKAWCLTWLNRELPITCSKDGHMIELWDDRCVQVMTNLGEPVDGMVSRNRSPEWTVGSMDGRTHSSSFLSRLRIFLTL